MFVKGQKVRMIDFPDAEAVALFSGKVLTVGAYGTYEEVSGDERDFTPPGDPKCVVLQGVPKAFFRETRFEPVEETPDVT